MTKFSVRTPILRILRSARAMVLAAAFASIGPQQAYAQRQTPPPVPDPIQVPAGQRLFLAGHAYGYQNYICLPSGAGFAWTLFGPQATLFHNDARQMMTHFLSPNPDEAGTLRATWQHSVDTSAVWATGNRHVLGSRLRCAGRDPMAPARSRGSGERTHRRQKADGGDPHSAAEHGGRDRSGNRLFTVGECRDPGLRPVRSRLLLLQRSASQRRLKARLRARPNVYKRRAA